MTDTPETDHLENGLGTAAEMSHPTLWAFARKLERERDDAIEMMKRTRDNSGQIIASQAAENILLTEQRDRLAEALQNIKNELGVPQPEYPAPIANAVKFSDEALQYLKQTNE